MEDIGRRLQAARLAKGFTLQDAEDETRIRKKYLEGLETGRTTAIPGDVYVKGFLRTYGNFLDLDGEALVEEYKSVRATKEQGPANGETGNGSITAAALQESPPRPEGARPGAGVARPGDRPPRRPAIPRPRASSAYGIRRAVVGLVILVPLVAFSWWLFGKFMALPKPPPSVTDKQEPPVATKQPDSPVPEPKPEPAKPALTMTGPKGEDVGVAVSVSPVSVQLEGFHGGFPWMKVWRDGAVVFEGYPKGPVTYDGKEVTIRLGFIDGVDVVINGQKLDHQLKSGPYNLQVTGTP